MAGLAQWPPDWLIGVAHHAAQVPAASLPWPTGWLGGVTLAMLIIAVVVALRSRRFRVLIIAVLAGVFVVVIPVRVVAPAWPPTGWAMVDCDVGQGDGEVLATSQPDRAVVVDTGPDENAIDECLSRLGITSIPMVILSHLHADHVGGLAAVLRNRSVGAVAVGPSRVPAWAWTQVKQETAAAHVPLVELSPGQHLQWPGLAMDVIGPPATESWPRGDDPSGTVVNNSSLVLRAQTAAGRILLTGDIELAAQADLLDARTDLTADILKIPHHGSRYSAPGFLDAVHAQGRRGQRRPRQPLRAPESVDAQPAHRRRCAGAAHRPRRRRRDPARTAWPAGSPAGRSPARPARRFGQDPTIDERRLNDLITDRALREPPWWKARP